MTLSGPAEAGQTEPAQALTRIPDAFLDLAECPPVAALTTLMSDGRPQTSVVWSDLEAPFVRVNSMRGFLKERNMRRDPRVTLFGYDPREPLRYLEIRGLVVEMTEDGALEHLDALTSKYMGRQVRYFGECIPAAFAETETPVLCRIRPLMVVARDFRGPGRRAAACGCPATDSAPGIARQPARNVGDSSASAHVGSPAAVPLPDSHLDLIGAPHHGVLTTLGPDGHPESSLVWLDHDAGDALVNTTLERRKGRNLLADPRVSLLVVDRADTSRFIQVRGEAELVRDGALEHLDVVTRRYTRHPAYYGHIFPEEQRERETRVIVRIHAARISLDAIHR